MPKSSRGYKYLPTFIDVATRWPEAILMRLVTAKAVQEGLETILSRNGIPRTIVSDNRALLTDRAIKDLCVTYGIEKIETSPYRPQSNGIVERFHDTPVPMLTKYTKNRKNWTKFLPLALYAIRLAPNIATGYSPFYLVHGRDLHSPPDLLYAGWVEEKMEGLDVTS